MRKMKIAFATFVLCLIIAVMLCLSCVSKVGVFVGVSDGILKVGEDQYTLPLALSEVFPYEDGGSTGFRLIDSNGELLEFYENRAINSRNNGKTLYGTIGDLGSDENRIIEDQKSLNLLYNLMERYIARTLSKEKIEAIIMQKPIELSDKELELSFAVVFLQEKGFYQR